MQETIYREITNRVLILGLDQLYREIMMWFEEGKLLPASRKLMSDLNVKPLDVPIEGYYARRRGLTEYFINMRSLQKLDDEDSLKVRSSDEYQLLFKVSSSPIYGQKSEEGKFFPVMKDPLYLALKSAPVRNWSAETLVDKAYHFAKDTDDSSLVGLGALSHDPILITAFRESTVLYSSALALGAAPLPPKYIYEWNVDKEIEERVNRFISIFNELTSSHILTANPKNAGYFYKAYKENHILGRCVRIAYDDSKIPTRYYHWAINSHNREFLFDEFWDSELWTTQKYEKKQLYLGRFNKNSN